jgi:predicted signal transduction protein with EAL and GGDEF domain
LQASILGLDVAGRLGGDEFAVIVHNVVAPEDAEAVARRIEAATRTPVDLGGNRVRASASIGIAIAAGGEPRPDELLHRADVAMYQAKRRGGETRWACWDEAMGTGDQPSLEDDLRAAVAAGELHLVYQPIVALPEGETTGVEALARWDHPTRGPIGPDVFIPLAERLGIIDDLGRWVLREACTQVRHWPVRLSVNVSARELEDDRFSRAVLATLQSTGVPARRLILEVSESTLLAGEVPKAHLRILSDAGIRIALDDFGTGSSSLQHLTQLPIAILKLDRCFVAALDGSREGAAVAQAVLRRGEALRLETIAEGVETEYEARELALLGCDSAQGYHFAHPASPVEIAATLATSWMRTHVHTKPNAHVRAHEARGEGACPRILEPCRPRTFSSRRSQASTTMISTSICAWPPLTRSA